MPRAIGYADVHFRIGRPEENSNTATVACTYLISPRYSRDDGSCLQGVSGPYLHYSNLATEVVRTECNSHIRIVLR